VAVVILTTVLTPLLLRWQLVRDERLQSEPQTADPIARP
jgi:hypothetical protein